MRRISRQSRHIIRNVSYNKISPVADHLAYYGDRLYYTGTDLKYFPSKTDLIELPKSRGSVHVYRNKSGHLEFKHKNIKDAIYEESR